MDAVPLEVAPSSNGWFLGADWTRRNMAIGKEKGKNEESHMNVRLTPQEFYQAGGSLQMIEFPRFPAL